MNSLSLELLGLIACQLDDKSFTNLSLLDKNLLIRTELLISDQHFFYLRTCALLGASLQVRQGRDWKSAYLLLSSDTMSGIVPSRIVLANVLAVEVCLEIGHDPSAWDNHAIRIASDNGHTEVVRFLLQDSRVDPSAAANCAIRDASWKGHTEVVRCLLEDKRVDPSACDNYAIIIASQKGYTEVVKLLLRDTRVDPSVKCNYPVRIASQNRHKEVVQLLLGDARVNPSAIDQ